MPFPYRDWRVFESAHMYGLDTNPVGTAFNQKADWNTTVYNYIKAGDSWQLHGGFSRPKERWHGLSRPTDSTFQSYTSLDEIMDIYIEGVVTEDENSPAHPQITLIYYPGYVTNAGAWLAGLVTGQTYNGADDWSSYADHTIFISSFYFDYSNILVTLANTPQVISEWGLSYRAGVGASSNMKQDDFFRNGLGFRTGDYVPGGVQPDVINATATMTLIRARYFNAVVNSLSANHAGTAGGEAIVLTGINFDPSDASLEEHAVGAPGAWNAEVARIYFEEVPGVPDYTLTPGAGVGKFVINSDGQITMTLPAMVAGDYYIRLTKLSVAGNAGNVHSYVGDFSANNDGLVTAGTRITFAVGDAFDPPTETQPLILTDWRFKNKAGDIALRSYAPIDAPSPSVFYDGRIINISSLKREVDDNTGLFSISDVTIDLANHDKEMSKLLADYFLKNQIVDIYQHFGSQPYADKTLIHKCIVDDYSLNGTTFSVLLKDITRKYFGVRVPRFRCTEAEYANIHDSAKGVAMPEVLGLCSVTGDTPGACEAVYINTVTFRYLAARGSLYSVDKVYSDNIEMTDPGDYSIVYADGGRTYIDFVLDQGDNKITFNCKGYMYDVLYDWNSGNGYIQNPIYITIFLLAFIAEIPWELIDITSFDTLAAEFVTEEWDTSGHLILQNETDLDEVLKDLLFTCGNYGFIAINGQFKVVRKDISDYTDTTLRIYDQIDVMAPAQRRYNLNAVVNYIQSVYNFYPAPNQSFGSFEDKRDSSIDDYEAEIETGSPVKFPWTNSLSLVRDRITSMLLKRGYGDNRISFSLSLKWFKQLDLLDNFQYQDPFGLSSTGAGEVGRYYYIISLNYNWMAATIDVEAVDLQWLLRQYFILGDYAVLAATWDLETEANKIYGFLCNYDTKEFSDGEPGKIISSGGD